jgi:ribosome biogenesis GTPase / thiamine phosphate phosphatase
MQGIIVKGIAGFYYVKVDEEVFECKARGKFRFDELTPMVGDRVQINVKNNKGLIEKVLPRLSELIRPMVANVTQAFVVFSLKNPDINMDLLNRFLALCEYTKLKTTVCLNKLDLVDEKEYRDIIEFIYGLGYEIVFLNAREGKGTEILEEKMKDNVTVLCGPSGAGKSTLMNRLSGKDLMKTGEVSDKIKRGKHTTRHSELVEVNDGFLVDTPGFSNIDITFIPREELQYCFPEFSKLNRSCRFNGCLHYKEPDCAVKRAVEKKEVNANRYEFYIKALEEIGRVKKW